MIPQRTIDELITKHSNLEKDLSSGRIEKSLFAEKDAPNVICIFSTR